MATRFYGINFGDTMKSGVTEAGASPGKDIEVAVVYTSANNSKTALLNALRAVEMYITEDTWPPV